jgi:SPW repeat
VNLLLGVWLIVSPWVVGFSHTRAMHYSIGIGLVTAFLAGLELLLGYLQSEESPPSRGAVLAARKRHLFVPGHSPCVQLDALAARGDSVDLDQATTSRIAP